MHHSHSSSHHIEVYEKLREKLDKAPIGLPKTVSGVEKEILKVLFDEEEAKIAIHMPFMNFTADLLAEKTGKSIEYIQKILDEMAKKGTVWKGEKDGKVYIDCFRLLSVLQKLHFGQGWAKIQDRINSHSCGLSTEKRGFWTKLGTEKDQ
jgi:hypothetical protein